MINTCIIGTGYLSNNLKKKISGSKIYSAKDFINIICLVNKKKKKINLIINSFFSANKLNDLKSYEEFVNKSIFEISKILDLLNPKIINKIIYTSSSSIYSSVNNEIELKDHNNRNLYSAFKIASESLLKNHCNKKKIPLNICRVFNIYGKDDKFSIIQKLKMSKKNNYKVLIYNLGLSVRDFIHIDDVVAIYISILKKLNGSGLYDVGTGYGVSIIEIIDKLKIKKNNLIYKKKLINELPSAIANNKNLLEKIKKRKFKRIEDFFGIKRALNYKYLSS
jgi:nucleoside-diphosphate-sugar epimerase